MSECLSLDIQDVLPEFVAERLDAADAARVAAHLAVCAPCMADVAVLRSVRAQRAAAPTVDVGRITAAVIAATGTARPAEAMAADRDMVERLIAGPERSPDVLPLTSRSPVASRRTVWRRVSRWQMAAALTLCVSGAALTTTLRHRSGEPFAADSVVATAGGGGPRVATGAADGAGAGLGSSVSYGDLSDYSEGELEAMMATLEGWDGAARVEPSGFDPVVSSTGGRGR